MSKVKVKSKKAKVKIVILGFCLFLLAFAFIAPISANYLIVEKNLERADAIWVLGGSGAYLERTKQASAAYQAGIAPKVFVVNDGVLSGWNQAEQRNIPFYELSQRELIAHGVPRAAIEILPPLVGGTKEEAELFIATARQQNLKSILLVTSPFHSRRTLWTFERAVIKNNLSVEIGLQISRNNEKTPSTSAFWLSPGDWLNVAGEYVKFAGYWLFY